MKNIFSRKHDTQTGNSKSFKFWPGSTQERSAPRPVPIQTDNTRIQAGIRAASATNLQASAAEDKPSVSVPTTSPPVEKTIYPTTRTYTVPQATLHQSRPTSSRHRDYNDAKYEPPRTGYLSTHSHDRAKGLRRVPSRNELAPTNRPTQKLPGPPDDRYREQPFHEDTERRRYRNEEKSDARYDIRKVSSSNAKESREVDEDRFRVSREQFREEYGTLPERHVTSQRPRDTDRARESESEWMREREKEKEKLRQRERERHQREYDKERERQKRERQQREYEKEQERERVRQKDQEMEKEREREELERELERRNAIEKEKEKERQRERQELERERQREERERQRQKQKEERERERERQRQKEEKERERQRQRESEKEKEKELERQRQRELEMEMEKEKERERERQKELERERLKEERERERQRQKERERERERHKELERQIELERERERERQKEERERELEKEKEKELERQRQRQSELEKEKERERQKELEQERLKEERERERQRQKERQKELERERLKEERERERERHKELERQMERERQIELERERERERQKEEREREREREIEREREREREHEKQKELERLKDLEQEKLMRLERERQKELEQERERREKDRAKREMTRNRARERERRDQEDHDRERLRHEEQELVILPKQSIPDLKPKDLDHGVDPSQRDSDKAERVIKAGPKLVEVLKPVDDGAYRKEKSVKEPHQSQEHYRQDRARAEVMDLNKDRLRSKTGFDRERRKEGKLGRVSDDQPSLGLRTSRQHRHERPVGDGWGDSSDDSEDPATAPQSVPRHDRIDNEKVPQSRQHNPAVNWDISTHGNQHQFRHNQALVTPLPLPPYATPRAAHISLASIDALAGRHTLPLASNLINIGTSHDSELVRREINRSKLNREDAEPLKPTEPFGLPSRVSFVQGIHTVQITPSLAQKPLAQMKDVAPPSSAVRPPVFTNEIADGPKEMQVKYRFIEDLKAHNVPIVLPVDTVLNSRPNIAGGSQIPPGDDKGLKTFPDPSMELSQVPSMRQMGSAQMRGDKERRTTPDAAAATPAPINLTLPTEVHPTQMQLKEKVPRIALPQGIQNSTPSVAMDVERHQDPLVGSNTPLTTIDAPIRTLSSVTPTPNLATSLCPISNSPAVVSSTNPAVDPLTQILPSLPPQNILYPMNYQPTGGFPDNSTTAFVTSGQSPAVAVRPPLSYGNSSAPPNVPSSQMADYVRPPSPTSNFPAIVPHHNRESVALPGSSHIRVPQSGITAAQASSDAVLPSNPRQIVATGSKGDSPLLPKNKDENMIHQMYPENLGNGERVMEQRLPTRSESNRGHLNLPLDAPGDHSIPSFAQERVLHGRVQHDIEPSRVDNNPLGNLDNPSHATGLVSHDTITRPRTEAPVLEKTIEKPSTNHGGARVDVLLPTVVASLTTPSTYMEPVKYSERPFSNPTMATQNQARAPTELGRKVSPNVGRDPAARQTPHVPRDVGKLTTCSNQPQEGTDKEQTGPSIGRPRTNSGFRKIDPNDHHIVIADHKPLESQPLDQANIASQQGEVSSVRPRKKGHTSHPNGAISEDQTSRQDAQGQNQVVTSTTRLSMFGPLKPDHSNGLGPSYASPFVGTALSQTNRQSPQSERLQVTDLIGIPARPIDGTPKHPLLPHTPEVRFKVPCPDFISGTRPEEVVVMTSNEKVDAVLSNDGVAPLNALSGLKKDGSLARQWVVNPPTTTFPINLEAPKKLSNHNPSAQTAEHAVLSETIPAHPEFRGPQIANALPPIPHATAVSTTLESSLARSQVDIAPQIKIRHPIQADAIKRENLNSRTPMSSGAPDPPAVTTIPQKVAMSPVSQTLAVRPRVSFGKSPVVNNDESKPRNQQSESPETKPLKVEDDPVSMVVASTKVRSDDFGGQSKKRSSNTESPRIKKAEDLALRRVPLKDTDGPGKRKPSSKEFPMKVTATICDGGVSKQDVQVAVHVSSRQDNTEQLRSSKLSTQQLPVIAHQTDYNLDVPLSFEPKIQHPVLAELLSSPQTTPVTQLTPVQASDKGFSKEGRAVHLGLTDPGIRSRLHGTPPERHRPEVEKMQPARDVGPIGRSSHRKISSTTFQTLELPPLQEHHQVRAVDVVTRAKLARSSDQVVQDQRGNTENSIPTQPSQGSRITTQESNLIYGTAQIPESQRSTTMASRSAQQQPSQHAQGRHQHSAPLPLENPVQELPRTVTPSAGYSKQTLAQGRPVMGHGLPEKHVVSAPPSGSHETVPMTPASFAHSLTLKQTDSRQSNIESVNYQAVKRIRRFKLPPKQATPAQSYQVWHPGTSWKTPNSSPSQSSGVETPLQQNLNIKETNKSQSVPFPVAKGKNVEDVIAPFNYSTHKKKRSVSGASMEARNGTAPSTIVGSPNASMRSATPLPPPPTRDTRKATRDWVSKAEDRAQSRPKRRRPRPGVVFDTDEDAPEDKQRPRRTLTKHRTAAKRHESPNS